MFAVRLGLDEPVRAALAANFERWNGRGFPNGVKGVAIPRPMRIAQLSQELEVLARFDGLVPALETIRARRATAYDPDLTDLVLAEAQNWWEQVEPADPWDAALALAPPSPPLNETAVGEALIVLADFADLKSPWTSGHSRAVAAPCPRSGRTNRGGGRTRSRPGPRCGAQHDLGQTRTPHPRRT